MRMARLARVPASAWGVPRASRTVSTLASTLIQGKSANPWKTMPTPGVRPSRGSPW